MGRAYEGFVFLSLLIQSLDEKLHSSHIYRALQKVTSYFLSNIPKVGKTSFEIVEMSKTLYKSKS